MPEIADLTPRTEAGKRLLEREALNSRSFTLIHAEDILDIEAEAAAFLAALRERENVGASEGPMDDFESAARIAKNVMGQLRGASEEPHA